VLITLDDGTDENQQENIVLNNKNGFTWVNPMGWMWTDATTTMSADPSNTEDVHITVSYARQT